MTTNRDITFDIIKAIGILLVIIGHLADGFKTLISIIYIFHMPLFFIVSGYFFRKKEITKLFKRDFHSLIFPYLVVALCLVLYGVAIALLQQDYSKFKYWLNATLGEGKGPLWFLLAMFWCRMFYNILYIVINKMGLKKNNIICLVITFIPFALILLMDNPMKYNILCWLNGIYAMFYYSIGACIKEYNIIKQLSKLPPLLLKYCYDFVGYHFYFYNNKGNAFFMFRCKYGRL